MATVTTLAPIAAQLARAVSLEVLFPRNVIEEVLREHRTGAPAGEAELPEEVKPFFGHYCVVVRAAAQLLGAPAFDSLARFHVEVEEELPGGHAIAFQGHPRATKDLDVLVEADPSNAKRVYAALATFGAP